MRKLVTDETNASRIGDVLVTVIHIEAKETTFEDLEAMIKRAFEIHDRESSSAKTPGQAQMSSQVQGRTKEIDT